MKNNIDAIRREQAPLLRSHGMGYGKIAAVTCLTKGIVRNLCLNVPGVTPNDNLDLQMDNGEACSFCGAPIDQHGGPGRPRRFCSDHCRRQYWRLHRTEQKRNPELLFTRQCKYCGRPFEVYGKTDRKYCSRDHYLKHYFGDREERERQKLEGFLERQLSNLTSMLPESSCSLCRPQGQI